MKKNIIITTIISLLSILFISGLGMAEGASREVKDPVVATEIITTTIPTTTTTTTNTTTTTSTATTTTTTTTTTTVTTTEPRETYTYMDIPEGDTSFFTYMDGSKVTNRASAQFKFLSDCYVDENGLYRHNGDYVVAMGSYYSTQIGQRFRVTLENGNVFTVALGDCKADIHTDALHQYRPAGYGCKNVIEFIVNTPSLSDYTRKTGNIGSYEFFGSKIQSIERIDENEVS